MPYKLNGNCVVKSDTGETVPGGCHKSREEAVAHLRALYANVPEARQPVKKRKAPKVRS